MSRTYGTLALDAGQGRWVLTTVETHVAILLKEVFPRVPRTATSPFSFPADAAHAKDLDWFSYRYPMAMTPADRRRLRSGMARHDADVAEAGRILDSAWTPPETLGVREGHHGRHYQHQAANLAVARGALLLGDDTGLGKTWSAILFMLRRVTLPVAVVVPPNLQLQWARKIAEVSTLECHCVTTTKPYTLPDVPVVIFRYSNVRGWADVFVRGRFRSAVWDEIQELRNGTGTEKGIASMRLAEATTYQLGLSATPIFNMGDEIYEVLSFLPGKGTGHVLGTRAEFVREWASDGGRVRDPHALGMFLRDRNAMLRRTKGDVGQQMDRVSTSVIDVPYDHAEERKVEDLARTLAIRSLTGAFVERGRAARDLDILVRQATGLAKARGVAQFVRLLVESGQQVLLSGWHRGYHDIVLRELGDVGVAMYTGSETVTGKDRAKSEFLSGRARVLLISNRSGAGLDGIQAVCSTVVIGELDWSGEVHHQLIGRVDRDGQTLPVTAYYLVCDGGSDPALVEIVGVKASQSRGIVDPHRVWEVKEVDEGKLVRLAKDWLDRHGIVLDLPVGVDAPAGAEAAEDA